MDHDTAVKLRAAERYVIGELAEGECDAFEAHYFDCPECAEEVRWEQSFMANARAALRQAEPPERMPARTSPWWNPASWFRLPDLRPAFAFSLAGNLVLLAVCAYSILHVMPGLRHALDEYSTPRLAPAVAVPTIVRGDEPPIRVSSREAIVPLSFAVPQQFPQFSYLISREGGAEIYFRTVPAPSQRQDELLLSVPVARLDPGIYVVSLAGVDAAGQRVEIGRCRLQIQR